MLKRGHEGRDWESRRKEESEKREGETDGEKVREEREEVTGEKERGRK